MTTIERRAIVPNGRLGLLYDIYEDCVLGESDIDRNETPRQLYESFRCKLMDGKSAESSNLLKWIEIDDDLRLNILLKTKPRTGISAIVDHCHPVDEYTRFMHIRYDDRRQELHGYSRDARKRVPSSQEFGATHVITAVTFGIDVVLVLQLPPKR